MSNRTLALSVAGAVLLVDQITKQLALAYLSDGPVSLLGDDFLALRLVRNSGAAFGKLQGAGGWLALLAVVVAVAIVLSLRSLASRPEAAVLGLVLGGAVGNLSDRLFRGSGLADGRVVDFIDFSFWPTFNVADSALTVGAVLAVVLALRAG